MSTLKDALMNGFAERELETKIEQARLRQEACRRDALDSFDVYITKLGLQRANTCLAAMIEQQPELHQILEQAWHEYCKRIGCRTRLLLYGDLRGADARLLTLTKHDTGWQLAVEKKTKKQVPDADDGTTEQMALSESTIGNTEEIKIWLGVIAAQDAVRFCRMIGRVMGNKGSQVFNLSVFTAG